MYGFFYRLGAWLLGKLGAAVLMVVVALLGVGIWLYTKDQVDVTTRRIEYIAQLQHARNTLVAEQVATAEILADLRESVAIQEERIAIARRVMVQLEELRSWWEWWFGDRQQQQADEDQRHRMNALKLEAEGRLAVLLREVGDTQDALADLAFQVAGMERDLAGTEQSEFAAAHYLQDAWARSKVFLAAALMLFFFGPTVTKLLSYYFLAPWLARGKPIKFEESLVAVPHVRPSGVATNVTLWPGEVLRVKESFLQSSDDDLKRKSRMVFDWAIPITSLACGLTELVELRNGHAGEGTALTLSDGNDPHTELSVVEMPAGASLILRPSFLVGVITQDERKVKIRRRWSLARWQAWVTLQFRFFEFAGPCRLVVAGTRGVKAEILRESGPQVCPARRTNQRATIGFTPNLGYLPVRAETFWSYYRDMNPLFDDLFAGEGLFVAQKTTTGAGKSGPARFWAAIWNAILKVFGI